MTEFRFQEVDDTNRRDHAHLIATDACVFLREYTSHKNYSFSETNSHISNLKKKAGAGGYQYKAPAIRRCSEEMAGALNPDWLKIATLVPVPPSKVKGDPNYDDRILRVCQGIGQIAKIKVDVREFVRQTQSIQAAHETQERPTVNDLLAVYEIDEGISAPAPQSIGIVDDVLTAGTHYRAMHTLLSQRFPGVQIVGIFWARRVLPHDEPPLDLSALIL